MRDGAIARHCTFCTRVQAGYQVDELRRYSAESQDSPEYVLVHRAERFAEIHIGCQQLDADIAQTLSESAECQDAIYGRLLERETTARGGGELAAFGGHCREFTPESCLAQRGG